MREIFTEDLFTKLCLFSIRMNGVEVRTDKRNLLTRVADSSTDALGTRRIKTTLGIRNTVDGLVNYKLNTVNSE